MKRDFLCVYDYGMGGLWFRITAENSEQIRTKYPMLEIFVDKPSWMPARESDSIGFPLQFDIEDQTPELLRGIIAEVSEEKNSKT
jgi:hypothetical protein